MADDFTKYDAYVNHGSVSIPGLLAWEEEKPQTETLPARPQRVDTGENRFEARPEYGDWFAQGDYSGGMGQLRYHSPKSDETKHYWSEGMDLTYPGRLRLLWETSAVGSSDADQGHALEIANGLLFGYRNDAGAARVIRYSTTFPLTETLEDPHAGEGNQTIQDLASSGDEVYAALTTNGIHVRSTGAVWSHYVTQGTTVIDRIEWLKNRLMASDGRRIYEITASGALPTPLETLPVGWRFEAIWEQGAFIYAAAFHKDSGHCNIHHYGLNQSVTGLEPKGVTAMPRGQLVYSGCGYLGIGYVGGGKKNNMGGLEPFVYQTIADAQGFLNLVKLAEREASSSNELPVRTFEPFGETVFFGWTLGSTAVVDERIGLAVHYLDRDAFAHHLSGGLSGSPVTGVKVYKGRLVYVVAGDRTYFENVGTYPQFGTDQNYLVTSVADFNNAGTKLWDYFEISHSALGAEEEVQIQYTTKHPDKVGLGSYVTAVTSDDDGAEGDFATLPSPPESRQLTVRIRIKPNTARTSAPEVYSHAVRAVPAPAVNEFVLTRTYRVLERDRKDENATLVYHDVDVTREALQELVNTKITFSEPGQDWDALVVGVTDVQPILAEPAETTGEEESRGYIIRLQMVARKI